MPHKTLPTRLLTAMMATGLMLATTAALAQGTSRAEQRRAERAAKADEAQQVDKFAGATRKEPEADSSRASSTRLGKLSDAYEAQDVARTQALADEIIADEKSNAYERSVAARIAGALMLGEDEAKALEYFERALEFDGLKNREHYEVMYIIAQLHAQDERYDQALATIDRLVAETSTTDPDIAALRGNVLLRLERYDGRSPPSSPGRSPEAKPSGSSC